MVVNFCSPHFYTTAHCNKLCADGYDVTNLVSADPALQKRGFKLEYFLRPPVQGHRRLVCSLDEVTLKFGFQVELCRVDVELWPWGMDRGQACKRLEISTSSDLLPSTGNKQVQQKEQTQVQVKDQNAPNRDKHESKSRQSNGLQWSLQAQHWGEETPSEPQQRCSVFKVQSNTEPSNFEPEFKLVARCELKEETKVSFTRSNFCPRAPFLTPPPPQPANCRQEELWSRGLLSLGAVTQLRVTVPWGGAASSLGLKALAVWGQPARSCPAEEVERIRRVHEASERQLLQQPAYFAPTIRQSKQPLQEPLGLSIPEEFLDPITQEVMMLPMLLPSGVSVDNSTLEEYQKREATWGRPPNDPFTGVPFTSTSRPLPNPQLKSRIDHFMLQKGMMRRDGMLGRQDPGENLQASRLTVFKIQEQSQNSLCLTKCSNSSAAKYNADPRNRTVKIEDGSEPSSDIKNHSSNAETLSTNSKSASDRRKKRDLSAISKDSTDVSTAERELQTKRPKSDAVSVPSCSSHEQRLSASLDEALFSALQGRPSFTSNLPQQRRGSPDSELLNTTQQCKNSGYPSGSTGEKTCSACSCSVSVYSTLASSIYRLSCGHLLCRACLQKESKPSATISSSNCIVCSTCQSPTPRAHIVRVHH